MYPTHTHTYEGQLYMANTDPHSPWSQLNHRIQSSYPVKSPSGRGATLECLVLMSEANELAPVYHARKSFALLLLLR